MVANDQAVDAHSQGIRFDERSNPLGADVGTDELFLYSKVLGTESKLYTFDQNDTVKEIVDYAYVTESDGATVTFDLSKARTQEVTLGGNRTIAFSNPTTGMAFRIILKQDGTGSRTVTWPAAVDWPGGTAPTLSTAASSVDVFGFIYDGTNYLGVGTALDLQ